VQHGPAGITATPTEPKHLGTRLHRWNHANPASSHDPPSDYTAATSECTASQGRGHRRAASVKSWPAPDGRCKCPLFALSHGHRTALERTAACDGSLDSAMSGLPLPSAQPESVRDASVVSANYESDTTLVNSTCRSASIGDRLACPSIAAILLTDRVLALDTTGW
jgi:hypothetical protein